MPSNPEFENLIELLNCYLQDRSWEEHAHHRINWATLLNIAHSHRVTPLLYSVIKDNSAVPEEVREKLRRLVLQQSARQVRAARELVEIVSFFQSLDIEAVAFKGLVLGALLYKKPGYRLFADLDLFLPRQEVKRGIDLLSKVGYKSHLLHTHPDLSITRHAYTLELFHPQKKILFDLHWDVTDGYVTNLFTSEELIPEAKPFDEAILPQFSLPVTLVLLSVHGAKSSWSNLSALMDLALFFERFPDLDYARVVQKLQQQGIGRMLFVGALMVEFLWDVHLPQPILRTVDNPSRKLATFIVNQFFEQTGATGKSRWAKVRFDLRVREKASQKLHYLRFKSRRKKVDLDSSNPVRQFVSHGRRVLRI